MKRYALAVLAAALLAVGCGSDDTFFASNNFNPNNPINNNPNNPITPVAYRQIENLARPGINEALFFTNAFLNGVNAATPAQAAAVLSDATNPITMQALAVLDALTGAVPGQGLTSGLLTTPQAVAALIPDVMRIDATLSVIPPTTGAALLVPGPGIGTQAVGTAITSATPVYNQAFLNSSNSPYAGRKLTDDVIDFTYLALLSNSGDGVTYNGLASNPATGHQLLQGQAESSNDPAVFPYLAPAN